MLTINVALLLALVVSFRPRRRKASGGARCASRALGVGERWHRVDGVGV
ncbi:hypothetical protein AB0A81_37760 [Streptomyces flaveolus]|uniref:Uncharacterized protein n=1 Tax=Streptomyces flaveolus TaxID=67297 RepID=A0ABV1VJ45_9ACTN